MDRYGRLLRDVMFPVWERLRGRPLELNRYLAETEWQGLDQLEVIQTGLLRRLVRHAYAHVPYYKRVMDAAGVGPEDIRSAADIARLPLLDRDVARATVAERTADVPPFATVRKATGGSTGQPMELAYNDESQHWREAIKWRAYRWAGFGTGVKSLHYWGMGAVKPKTRLHKWKSDLDHGLKREVYVDCTPRGDDALAAAVAQIRAFKPDVILTYAQAGAALARYITRMGARNWASIPLIVGAERLWPHDREAMAAAFGPDIFETYGCREVMLIGSECAAHDGLHLSMENLIVELIVRAPDGTTRLARPGEVGEVAVTDLHNLSNPFIRYLLGDQATARAPERCSCGRWHPRIGPIEGRVTETMRDGKGNPVSGLVFSILFVPLAPYTRQFQAVQHIDGSVTVRVVLMEPGPIPAAVNAAKDAFCAKYLPGVQVTLQAVDDIPPTKAGKRQVVVVERPPAQ
jgi:phenylacetate-CoA ligase